MFSKNSTSNRNHIKNRIIKENLMKYECECGNTGEWKGKKLVLQLEHKNGDTLDNRLENLTFLCPNCHSQTSTFSGRNAKKQKKEKVIKKCECGKNIHSTSINCCASA